jgi:hypothetical protein
MAIMNSEQQAWLQTQIPYASLRDSTVCYDMAAERTPSTFGIHGGGCDNNPDKVTLVLATLSTKKQIAAVTVGWCEVNPG